MPSPILCTPGDLLLIWTLAPEQSLMALVVALSSSRSTDRNEMSGRHFTMSFSYVRPAVEEIREPSSARMIVSPAVFATCD